MRARGRLVCIYVVCPLESLKGARGRLLCSLSPDKVKAVPREGSSLSPGTTKWYLGKAFVQPVFWCSERGVRGRLLCSLSPGSSKGVPGEGFYVVCLLVTKERGQGKTCLMCMCSLSSGAPLGGQGKTCLYSLVGVYVVL